VFAAKVDIVATLTLDDDMAGRLAALVPWLQQRAAQLDAAAAFPAQETAALHAAGVMTLALPVDVDRSPDGTPSARADRLAAVLVQLGLGSLAVGRIIEAHTNARQLIARNGASD
jgi:hypothetical protein